MRSIHAYFMKAGFAVLLIGILWGCFGGAKPPVTIHQYALEYPIPAFRDLKPLDGVVRLERFTVMQNLRTPMMVYQTEPYKYEVDHYNRWQTNPGDMVTDYLLRDFRNAGVFKAVFSYLDLMDARFLVQGGVEAFYQADEGDGQKAFLSLQVTLLDTLQKDITRKVIFQKRYHTIQPLDRKGPVEFARAMSKALAGLSRQIITDVYSAVKALQGS